MADRPTRSDIEARVVKSTTASGVPLRLMTRSSPALTFERSSASQQLQQREDHDRDDNAPEHGADARVLLQRRFEPLDPAQLRVGRGPERARRHRPNLLDGFLEQLGHDDEHSHEEPGRQGHSDAGNNPSTVERLEKQRGCGRAAVHRHADAPAKEATHLQRLRVLRTPAGHGLTLEARAVTTTLGPQRQCVERAARAGETA